MRSENRFKRPGAALLGLVLAVLLAGAAPAVTYADTISAGEIYADSIFAGNTSADIAAADSPTADTAPESEGAFIAISSNETAEADDDFSDDIPTDEEDTAGDSVSSDDAVCDSVSFNELPYGLPGMGEGYILSRELMDRKYELIEHDVLETLRGRTGGVDYEERTLILNADDPGFAEQVAAAYGAELRSCRYGVAAMILPEDGISVLEAVEAGMDPALNIPPVEPNYYMHLEPSLPEEFTNTPAEINAAGTEVPLRESFDTLFGSYVRDPFLSTWDGNNNRWLNDEYQWFHDMVHTYPAWGVTTGSPHVNVAVIDTGVSLHEEFGDRLIRFDYQGSGEPIDPYGHGTHVAGIIAAGLNDKGGAGIAPGVTILSFPVCTKIEDTYVCTTEDTVAAVERAVFQGADIINMSIGTEEYSSAMGDAVRDAYKNGVTVVAAAGNESSNCRLYPAAFPHVISVAAVDYSGKKTGFSNFGPWVDVAAPGIEMTSAYNGALETPVNPQKTNTTVYREYGSMTGTSQATPVVAGACALYMSAAGHVDPDTMEKVIKRSVSKAGSSGIGIGIIDLSKLFAADRTPPKVETSNGTATLEPNEKIRIEPASYIQYSVGIRNDTNNGKILYTINGRDPAILNGKIVNGTLYSTPLKYDDLVSKYPAGTKITVRAAVVTGLGVLSKVKKVTFTMGKRVPLNIQVTADLMPGSQYRICAGGTAKLRAEVTPKGAPGKVYWSIDRNQSSKSLSGAKINRTTGRLTTPKGRTGQLYIDAVSAADSNVRKTTVIEVTDTPRASALKLDRSKAVIYAGDTEINDRYSTTLKVKSLTYPKNAAVKPGIDDIKYRWTSSNTGVAKVSETTNSSVVVTAVSKGKAKITCTAMDGSGRRAVCTVTVGRVVDSITVTGPGSLPKGRTAVYKAQSFPANASDKSVRWSLDNVPSHMTGKVSINEKTGAVTVASDVTYGDTFRVKAVANDTGRVDGACWVRVANEPAASMKFQAEEFNVSAVNSAPTNVKSVRLYTANVPDPDSSPADCDERILKMSVFLFDKAGGYLTATDRIWTTTNPKVVAFDDEGKSTTKGGTVYLHAIKPGKAKIICKADDGSGRTGVVDVQVIVPASGMKVSSVGGQEYIAAGRSARAVATPGKLHGKPSVSKVKWDYVLVDSNGTPLDEEIVEQCKKSGAIKVKNGKVSVARRMSSMAGTNIEVSATTTDGTYRMDYATYVISRPGTYLNIGKGIKIEEGVFVYPVLTDCEGNFTVTSSDPRTLSAYYIEGVLEVFVHRKTGTATITMKATDGSNRKKTITLSARSLR